MRRLLASPDVRLYLGGQGLSMLGDSALWLMAMQGAAAVVAGAAAATVLRRVGEPALCAAGLLPFAAACPLLATSAVATALTGSVLMGCGIPWTMVGLDTLLQRLTPPALQGRVFDAMDMLVAIPHVASIAGGAALVATVDHRLVLAAMAMLLAAGAAPLLMRRDAKSGRVRPHARAGSARWARRPGRTSRSPARRA